jgi:hypothetical protein
MYAVYVSSYNIMTRAVFTLPRHDSEPQPN